MATYNGPMGSQQVRGLLEVDPALYLRQTHTVECVDSNTQAIKYPLSINGETGRCVCALANDNGSPIIDPEALKLIRVVEFYQPPIFLCVTDLTKPKFRSFVPSKFEIPFDSFDHEAFQAAIKDAQRRYDKAGESVHNKIWRGLYKSS